MLLLQLLLCAVGAVVVNIPFDVHAVAVADAFTAVLAAAAPFFVPMILNSVQLTASVKLDPDQERRGREGLFRGPCP